MDPEALIYIWIFGAFCSGVGAIMVGKTKKVTVFLAIGWFVVIPILFAIDLYED